MKFDHLLLLGFGGPTKPEEIRPFLNEVARGVRIPEERLSEVERHYGKIGGRSPYNEKVFALQRQLREALEKEGCSLSVFVGMRNWNPFIQETLAKVKEGNPRRGLALVLAPHRCEASFERYVRRLEEVKKELGMERVEYEYLGSWHDHPLYVEAESDEARRALESLPSGARRKAAIVFSVHSIPVKMAETSSYVEEVEVTAKAVAEKLGCPSGVVAYQSRSGNSREPWLEPDGADVVRSLKEKGCPAVVVVPIGFLCDNAEVLYDLDIELCAEVEKLGMAYRRAQTVGEHPRFIAMLTQRIKERL